MNKTAAVILAILAVWFLAGKQIVASLSVGNALRPAPRPKSTAAKALDELQAVGVSALSSAFGRWLSGPSVGNALDFNVAPSTPLDWPATGDVPMFDDGTFDLSFDSTGFDDFDMSGIGV